MNWWQNSYAELCLHTAIDWERASVVPTVAVCSLAELVVVGGGVVVAAAAAAAAGVAKMHGA